MICQHCKEKNATHHYRLSINGKKIESYLCDLCAKNLGLEQDWHASVPFALPDIFSGYFTAPAPAQHSLEEKACPLCHSSLEDIQSSGRAGCPQCYEVFDSAFVPYLQKVHGATRHVGRMPQGLAGVIGIRRRREELEEKMRVAIARQEFEEAAALRDELKALKQEEEEGQE